MMNKKQLVKEFSHRTGLTLAEGNAYLDTMLDIFKESFRNEEGVFLRGFGSFLVKDRKERRTLSLNTREMIVIPGKKVVKFRESGQ